MSQDSFFCSRKIYIKKRFLSSDIVFNLIASCEQDLDNSEITTFLPFEAQFFLPNKYKNCTIQKKIKFSTTFIRRIKCNYELIVCYFMISIFR
jgi:hypothetical protein